MRLHATAKVTVVLEIDGASGWGEECTVRQVHDQAVAGARGTLQRLLKDAAGVRLIGEPALGQVTIKEER